MSLTIICWSGVCVHACVFSYLEFSLLLWLMPFYFLLYGKPSGTISLIFPTPSFFFSVSEFLIIVCSRLIPKNLFSFNQSTFHYGIQIGGFIRISFVALCLWSFCSGYPISSITLHSSMIYSWSFNFVSIFLLRFPTYCLKITVFQLRYLNKFIIYLYF